MREKKPMYRIGIGLIGLAALGWVIVSMLQIVGIATASSQIIQSSAVMTLLFPLCGGAGVLLLLIQVISDRLNSKEDDYYSKNVER